MFSVETINNVLLIFRGRGEYMLKAMDIAKWFIQRNCDNPRNKIDGNMKLQKMLYFSQVIHLARTGESLFCDPILAFERGSVVEEVRLRYKGGEFFQFIDEAIHFVADFSKEQLESLQITEAIFCNLNANELSDINHLHKSWDIAYKNSLVNGIPQKHLSEISIDNIKRYDLEKIKDLLEAYEITKNMNGRHEVINGITFFYDEDEITMTDELIEELGKFKGEEPAYRLCWDKQLGLVIS